jgi:hypothetical protein
MKRKAVLIESSKVRGQNELPGARVDIQNWENFLLSDLGGAWKKSEIVILRHPYSTDVTREVDVSKDTYCFVAFSGHGSDGSVVLNDHNSSFATAQFRPKGGLGTVVVDACRGIEEARPYVRAKSMVNELFEGPVLLNSRRGRETNFALANEMSADRLETLGYRPSQQRKYFDGALDKVSVGIVEMLACAKGQGAGEDPSAGGYYTSLLLQSAELWHAKYTQEKIHTTKNAHEHASSVLLQAQQAPEYTPAWLEFPFAVKD